MSQVFCTNAEFTAALKSRLEARDYMGAARLIDANRNGFDCSGLGPSPWWVKWADQVIRGEIHPRELKLETARSRRRRRG